MPRRWVTGLAAILAGILAIASVATAQDDAGVAMFESRIRPILVERCFKCHSANAEDLKGGLRLDSRDGMLTGGDSGAAIEPGKPEESRLVEAIGYTNVDLQMPPKGKLPEDQIAALTDWIKKGAPWPKHDTVTHDTVTHDTVTHDTAKAAPNPKEPFDLAKRRSSHWVWQPVQNPQPPAVKHLAWVQDPIDRFILARLEAQDLEPAAPADRRALVRRIYFDVIGLPPTTAEVDAFLADTSPQAVEHMVDRLLALPQFGERWARHWLDLVRYAETRGHEFDYPVPNAYQYRDYVIRALNADVPYDQFVVEHIAGDLIERPRLDPTGTINESVLATGFWYLGEWLHSPVDIRQDEMDRVDNQIDVMAKTFLGLTVACARCHDHKFDAISTKDYYALAGFLHSSSCRDVPYQWQEHNRDIVRRIKSLDDAAGSQILRAAVDVVRPTIDRLPEYLLAAREVIRSGLPADRAQVFERAQAVARQSGLDAELLVQWIDQTVAARADAFSPLHPWAAIASDTEQESAQRVAQLLDPIANACRAEQARTEKLPDGASIIVDYVSPSAEQWIANGYGFGEQPFRTGQVVLGANVDRLIAKVFERSAAYSGGFDGRLPSMLRTATFTITAPRIWCHASGASNVFLCIDSHRQINGPLHGMTKRAINIAQPGTWETFEVKDYIGQRAHFEFTPTDVNAPLAVSAVVQGDGSPPAASRANQAVLGLMSPSPPKSAVDLANRYRELFAQTLSQLADGAISDADFPTDRARLADWLVERLDQLGFTGPEREPVARMLGQYRGERAKLLDEIKDSGTALAMIDANGVDEHVLVRGSHKNVGDPVPRRLLEALAGAEQPPIEQGSGRLELARRMTAVENPLVARVIVNRIWHHLFGRGIVSSVDNFGVLGEMPTHPELLDHLATRFVAEGWSIKKLIRELVLSSTYQMASTSNPATDQVDPDNRLLSHARIRRLEGETIRDEILAISGRLNPQMYGESVAVFLTPFMEGRGRPTASGPMDGDGRRSIYVAVRRNFLPPMMLAFDTPVPFNTIGRRTVSNVPAQALILMNDPFVVEQARQWSSQVLANEGLSSEQRITRMYLTAFARPPSEAEVAAAAAFLESQGAARGVGAVERANDLGVWSDFAHVLMNAKEFVYIN